MQIAVGISSTFVGTKDEESVKALENVILALAAFAPRHVLHSALAEQEADSV